MKTMSRDEDQAKGNFVGLVRCVMHYCEDDLLTNRRSESRQLRIQMASCGASH
jgi:hypothetical protein